MRLLSSLAAAALGLAAFAAPSLAQTPVRVGIIPVLGVSPILIIDKEGWAKEAGLDLKITTFESGPLMIQALASGTLDVYVAGVAPLGVARSKGIDVRVVAATATAYATPLAITAPTTVKARVKNGTAWKPTSKLTLSSCYATGTNPVAMSVRSSKNLANPAAGPFTCTA